MLVKVICIKRFMHAALILHAPFNGRNVNHFIVENDFPNNRSCPRLCCASGTQNTENDK